MPHDNPIHQLTHEHHHILQVVHGLSAIDQELAAGRMPDLARLRDIVAFMREFADQCHHAKEEAILFPAMEDKGVPHDDCPLEGLLREHARGRELVGALATATAALAGG
ncbi:MAG: hemerythrin domain-containing protein, partial [Candidatus Macondimonas sp.]